MRTITTLLGGLGIGIAAVSLAAPALAQEDIVVQGHYGRSLQDADTASAAVSYADLDLSTPEGQHILDRRIHLTARYVCEKLGEGNSADPLMGSCEQQAVSDTMDRLGTLEQDVAPRGTAWVRPAQWAPPYPASWDSSYSGGYDTYSGY